MPNLPGMVKFAIVFAVTGLIISVVFGLIGQNRLSNVLITAFISTVISALLGAAVYKVIEIRVPELLTLFDREPSEADGEGYGEGYDPTQIYDDQGGFSGDVVSDAVSSVQEEDSSRVFGDHILVNNKIKIKNEPKLIAKAIQTMLAKDEG